MEDVCLKTEVHDHDQLITSGKLCFVITFVL